MTDTTGPSRFDIDIRADGVTGRVRAMACDVTARIPGAAGAGTVDAVTDALGVFVEVEQACTRFDPASPLMLANAHGLGWAPVPGVCFDALTEAYRAHLSTDGAFDPRVLTDLVTMGYDSSLRFGGDAVSAPEPGDGGDLGPGPIPGGTGRVGRWQPRFRPSDRSVQVGPRPVDLGGIGKGLAVRWAAERLSAAGADLLVDAGGDCWCGGRALGGEPWLVGVEDPGGGEVPLAVLGLSDRACATSSVRVRRWRTAGREVHHLVDPSTGRPGGEGLAAVTVVGPDPAEAEVWAKALFLAGTSGIAGRAEAGGLAALWVDADGRVGATPAMERWIVWRSW
ncbi:MAG TPA: FAD:protein FMN transferase [Acidimicrobiales bacterium]|nr:FAD:protein FMN transferase [Acidimicrobiales bacterium]